jgi:hypothetical protein
VTNATSTADLSKTPPWPYSLAASRSNWVDRLRDASRASLLSSVPSASRKFNSMQLLRRCLARFLQFRPVRRVFECLVVLRQRVSRLALLGKHVAPCFQRIGPVRLTLIRLIELRLGAGEVTVASERDAQE